MEFRLTLNASPDIPVEDVVTLLRTMREAISYFPRTNDAYEELNFHRLKTDIRLLTKNHTW